MYFLEDLIGSTRRSSLIYAKLNNMSDEKNKIKIFHHVPKCGGTAIREVLNTWFDLVLDYISLDEVEGIIPVRPPIQLSSLQADQCLCGHYEVVHNHLFTRYPELKLTPQDYQTFTLVRNPLDLRVSLYYYEIKEGRRNVSNQTLSEFLMAGNNYLANRFPCTQSNYKDVVNRYTIVGLQENLQDYSDCLSKLFSKPRIELDRANVATRDEQYHMMSKSDVDKFMINNQLDYSIYNYAKELFIKTASSLL